MAAAAARARAWTCRRALSSIPRRGRRPVLNEFEIGLETPARQWTRSVSQRLGSDRVNFPGALESKFTNKLEFWTQGSQEAMPTYRIMDAEGNIVDKEHGEPDMAQEDVAKLYTDMLTVSIMDLIMFDAQRQGRLSFYMVNAGEEGIGAGTASALTLDDVVYIQYREAAMLQHRGMRLDEFMAQLFATVDDEGKGRNMPVHYGSGRLKVHTASSPLATQIPQAAGAAYALKLKHRMDPKTNPPAIVACYFGEGAASEGDFHAGLNIAATRSCPVVFVCRNNGFAISTASLEQYKGDGIASRGVGYGIDTVRVDGNDVFAVREVMRRARAAALAGDCRPVLVEAMSYRVSHHSTSDDSFAYRAKVEVEEWKRRDNPIVRLRKYMERRGWWDEARDKAARSEIRAAVLAAFNAAEGKKKPPLRNLWTDVYAELTDEQRAQMAAMHDIITRYPGEYPVDDYEGGADSLKERD